MSRWVGAVGVLTCGFLVACATVPTPAREGHPAEQHVEHFKVWKVGRVAEQRPVRLLGQFDEVAWPARVDGIEYVANPVEKNGRPVRFPDRHLVGYFLAQPDEATPRRWVTFTNQLGAARWRLTDPALLLLPASKVFDGEPPEVPGGLDHFVCYLALAGDPIEKPLTLVDQFDRRRGKRERIRRLEPAYFCLPVEKNEKPRIHPEVHLALYDLDPRDVLADPIVVRTRDQFGARELKASESLMLGVPSTKTGWGPDPDGDQPD